MKTLITTLLLCLALVFSAEAQVDRKVDKSNDAQSVRSDAQDDMSKHVKELNDRMTRDLGLTKEQSEDLMERNKMYYSEMSSLRSKNLKDSELKTEKQKAENDYQAALKRILKENQYKKFASNKERYMKDIGNNMSNKSDMMDDGMHK